MNTDTKTLSFKFTVRGILAEFVSLRLFDGSDREVTQKYEMLSEILEPGFYKLRIEFNEFVKDNIYRVSTDIDETYDQPASWSSMVSSGFASSHEYYAKPFIQYSKEFTASVNKDKSTEVGGLLLFIRYPDVKAAEEKHDLYENFYILNDKREILFKLDASNTANDKNYGWMAFHVALEEGNYSIVYNGEVKTEMPLFIFQNWQTQLFMMYKDMPLFSTARILIVRDGSGFRENEITQLKLDALLQKIQNGIYYVPPSLIREAAHGKWENPVLAIAVAYCYLLSNDTEHNDLFLIILRNLENKILRNHFASDILALRLLSDSHSGKAIDPEIKVSQPPMFLVGMKILINHSVQLPDLFVAGSAAEKAVAKLKYDTVLTSYEPITDIKQHSKQEKANRRGNEAPSIEESPSDKSISPQQNEIVLKLNISLNYIPFFSASESDHSNWISNSIFNHLSNADPGNGPVDINSIASQLSITPNLVREHLKDMPNLEYLSKFFQSQIPNAGNINPNAVKNFATNMAALNATLSKPKDNEI
ncbi:hypothetical protein [Pinibacter aurantiacus]|uniref:Uncharacterized protein n=1 Tax=Pinibacter aurantiacus TaxID=2851599 RepID=A0A9E2W553_9BACT|nr:hypothetical protein [Pinibacter aurantiacus]MBV4360495.1 hypothetical protein [Pinibacter aurantiacus]